MTTFRVLAALLNYPREETIASLDEMREILAEERLLSDADRAALDPLFRELADLDIYDLQGRYVELFDQSRSLSLHLFEHVHGESLDRGQAMVDLLERYRAEGLELSAVELPDFLPVYLEYLSQLSVDDARAELGETGAVIAALARRLHRRQSSYAAVLDSIAHLAPDGPARESEEETQERDGDPSPDAEWQEEPVDFSKRETGFVRRQRARALGARQRRGE